LNTITFSVDPSHIKTIRDAIGDFHFNKKIISFVSILAEPKLPASPDNENNITGRRGSAKIETI
jgi:hypothetical protein